ncbi:hypothetical protein [Kitasatospora mediocidica]|uniref:hypothetical protein n=1 Tax=Kitasatospora mediocidica TaxID=58352 RepID=UPI00056D671A|nr:hypothetical protein [Kitasatospora mediocidica]
MAGGDARDLQLWGGVAVVGAALAVVAGYLADGAPLVLAVALVEVLLVMVYVGRRFRYLVRRREAAEHGTAANAAHCERCHRARERHGGLAERRGARPGAGSSDWPGRPPVGQPVGQPVGSADRVVGHQ